MLPLSKLFVQVSTNRTGSGSDQMRTQAPVKLRPASISLIESRICRYRSQFCNRSPHRIALTETQTSPIVFHIFRK